MHTIYSSDIKQFHEILDKIDYTPVLLTQCEESDSNKAYESFLTVLSKETYNLAFPLCK